MQKCTNGPEEMDLLIRPQCCRGKCWFRRGRGGSWASERLIWSCQPSGQKKNDAIVETWAARTYCSRDVVVHGPESVLRESTHLFLFFPWMAPTWWSWPAPLSPHANQQSWWRMVCIDVFSSSSPTLHLSVPRNALASKWRRGGVCDIYIVKWQPCEDLK